MSYPSYPAPPPGGDSGAKKGGLGLPIWLEIVIGAVAGPFLVGGASFLPLGLFSSMLPSDSPVIGLAALGGFVLPLAVIGLGLTFRQTRWLTVGALIGLALWLIIAAGACFVMIATWNGGG